MILFPFSEYWWFYTGFTLLVLVLLCIDLGVLHRKAHRVSFREASILTLAWVTLAMIFNYGLYRYSLWKFTTDPRFTSLPDFDGAATAARLALEFLTGYVIEYALSVDNIFVFILVLTYFAIPPMYQHRVLFFGILGALVFRGIFIGMGSILLRYDPVMWLFGALLIFTGVNMLFGPEKEVDPGKNIFVRALRRFFPVSDKLEGQRFITRIDGRTYATPLLLALGVLEMTDIIFAADSVPAIFAITREPLIVFTSNVFAILGLRSLYFLLSGAVETFHYLKYGLGLILVFVGLKMVWLNHAFGGHFPIGVSLGIILGLLALSIVASLVFPKKEGSTA